MSKLGLVIVLVLMAGKNYAQDYFVLIQADNRQPFYVRLNNQLYSSSDGGHLILGQLKDSSYTITIGFPGQGFPEQRFLLDVHQNDQELRLKNEEGRGWRLYDIGGRELNMPDGGAVSGTGKPRFSGVKKDDAFSRLMAEVVHDTAVMYNTYAMAEMLSDSSSTAKSTPAGVLSGTDTATVAAGRAIAADTAAGNPSYSIVLNATPSMGLNSSPPPVLTPSPGKVDSSRAADTDTAAAGRPSVDSTVGGGYHHRSATGLTVAAGPPSRTDSTASAAPLYRSSGVVKLSEHKSSHSLRLVYADNGGDKKADTIVVIIPVDTPADTARLAASRSHGPNPDSPVLGTGALLRPRAADTSQKRPAARSALPFVNSDCHSYATDYDVDKLRVKMLESGKDDDRIQSARKVFKTKCFSTRQIRALSEVFTSDAAKFRFLEAAYPFVSDDRFSELVNLLADPVYSGKFRSMTDRQ
jgi:Domain of unknown function (DUF4476)